VFEDEIKAAQKWNGHGILNLLRKHPATGGPYLIADMNRCHTVFQLVPSALRILREGIEREGSNLSGVAARCNWRPWDPSAECDSNGGGGAEFPTGRSVQQSQPNETVERLNGVELIFNREAGKMLPLMLNGRVQHGRHFTFKCGDEAIMFIPPTVSGDFVMVDAGRPLAHKGAWLQLYVSDAMLALMQRDFAGLNDRRTDDENSRLQLPRYCVWPSVGVKIKILHHN